MTLLVSLLLLFVFVVVGVCFLFVLWRGCVGLLRGALCFVLLCCVLCCFVPVCVFVAVLAAVRVCVRVSFQKLEHE